MDKFYIVSSLVVDFYVLIILFSILSSIFVYAGERLTRSPVKRGRIYFIGLISPPLVAGIFLFLSFMPSIFNLKGPLMTCLSRVYCYIFPFIPEGSLPFYIILVIGLSLIVFTVVSSGMEGIRYMRGRRRILNMPSGDTPPILEELESIWGIKVRVVPVPMISCFIMGYLSPVLVIGENIVANLSPEELQGLLAHELAHHKRKDNLLRGILNWCRYLLYIFPNGHVFYKRWNETVELISDEMAVQDGGNPLEIASALLKIYGMGRKVRPITYGSPFYGNTGKVLEARIERLICLHEGREDLLPSPDIPVPSEGGFLFSLIILGITLFLTLFEMDPFFVHCHLEKLIAS